MYADGAAERVAKAQLYGSSSGATDLDTKNTCPVAGVGSGFDKANTCLEIASKAAETASFRKSS